ncbi:MAG: hypothetical protein JXB49_32400 [Bacteroidales bacterium]|nr:hypothetical protein [Bacteroidales bacterium]
MSKKVIIALLLIIGIFGLSIYDFTGNYRINFDISELQSNTISIDTNVYADKTGRYVEVVWSTGDTGSGIIINQPGTYIVSVKDVFNVVKADSSEYQQKCVFIYGYPDGVRIDTFVIDTVSPASFNRAIFHTIDIITDGVVHQVSYRDTSWTDESKSYYTETHPIYGGFWSGMLDTIIIQKQKLPVVINAKVMVNEGNAIMLHRNRSMKHFTMDLLRTSKHIWILKRQELSFCVSFMN